MLDNKQNVKDKFYSVPTGMKIIATLMKETQIIRSKQYNFEPKDFHKKFHEIMFKAIHNLVMQGANEVTPIMIDSYIKETSEKWYAIYNEFGGLEIFNNIDNFTDVANIDLNYKTMKKNTLMRDLVDNNIDFSDIYDISGQNIILNEAFRFLEVRDIIDKINAKMIKLKQDWNGINQGDTYGFKIGDGLRELKEKLKESPSWGYPFPNPYITAITRGMRKRKFMLLSGSSGSGKSRSMMANACYLGASFIYDNERRQWVKNLRPESVVYISTELEKEEVQTCFLAIISGIGEDKILDGTYSEAEEERLDKAIMILSESDIYIEYIADFDIQDIEGLIELHIIQHNIEYAFFDYIHTSPKLISSITKNSGMKMREDQILYLFGASLKQMANRYKIFIQSGTQLNRNYKDEENLDTNALRGASSLGDKLDVGMISLPVSEKEKKQLATIVEKLKVEMPTMSHTIYKNRGNKFKGVRVWTIMNLDCVREKTLFITNLGYEPINGVIEPYECEVVKESALDREILKYLNGRTDKVPTTFKSLSEVEYEEMLSEEVEVKVEEEITPETIVEEVFEEVPRALEEERFDPVEESETGKKESFKFKL